jgi:hypothetical protein
MLGIAIARVHILLPRFTSIVYRIDRPIDVLTKWLCPFLGNGG